MRLLLASLILCLGCAGEDEPNPTDNCTVSFDTTPPEWLIRQIGESRAQSTNEIKKCGACEYVTIDEHTYSSCPSKAK